MGAGQTGFGVVMVAHMERDGGVAVRPVKWLGAAPPLTLPQQTADAKREGGGQAV